MHLKLSKSKNLSGQVTIPGDKSISHRSIILSSLAEGTSEISGFLKGEDCLATIGVVGNKNHENIKIGKAGRSRWLGKRPKVRGVVMNPVDHPHGGGEGRTSGGRHPVSPWGTPAKGYKTRKKNKLKIEENSNYL